MRFLLLSLIVSSGYCQRPFESFRTQVGFSETFGIGNGLSAGLPGDDIFYAVARSGNVYTLQESTGLQINSYLRPDVNSVCNSRLVWDASDYKIGVFSERNNVILIDSGGTYIAEFAVTGEITGQPSIALGNVYVPHNDGQGKMTIYSIQNSLIVAQLSSRDVVGPVGTNQVDFAYYGSSLGTIRRLDQVEFKVQAVTNALGESATGAPFVKESELLIQGTSGTLYWWKGVIGNNPTYTLDLTDGIPSVGHNVAPILSETRNYFYVVSGSTIYALDPANGGNPWRHRSGVQKTKPVLDAGDAVYSVEVTDGRIFRFDSSSGGIATGYPYVCEAGGSGEVCNQGDANAYALLSDDLTKVFVVFDDGTLVATCVNCPNPTSVPSPPPSDSESPPTTSPTQFESPSPSRALNAPTSGGSSRRTSSCFLLGLLSVIVLWK